MNPKSLSILFLALMITLVSCRKEKEEVPVPNNDHSAAMDNSRAESWFTDALKQSDIAFKDGASGCIQSVTIDLDVMPHTMLVDFGNTNCLGQNGLYRRGRLFVTFTGPYTEPGTIITITPQDFYVNDHQLQGGKIVTNAGPNDQGQAHFTVQVNGTVTAPDGSWTSQHNYHRTRTWIEGESTPAILDDVYLITGGGNGINRNGMPFTVTITQPLRVEVGCPWIVSGVQQVVPQGLTPRVIDFGNGACDSQVTITVGNLTFNFG